MKKAEELLNIDEPWQMNPEEMKEKKFEALRNNFEHHYEICEPYRTYCKDEGISPDDINGYDDLSLIPTIPVEIFRKFDNVYSVPEEEIVKEVTTSSTTSDNPIRYVLNKEDIERTVPAIGKTFEKVGGLRGGNVLMMTPSPEETDVGMVQGMDLALKSIGYSDEDIKYLVNDGQVNTEKTEEFLTESESPIHIYGPPFALRDVAEYIKDKNIEVNYDEKNRVLTTGGWKGVEDKMSREDFTDLISNTFNIEPEQYRDTYGLTDVFGGMVECGEHNKHVPPWIHASIIDPDSFEEVEEGEEGLVTFMNSLIEAYPSMTLPGDMGALYEDSCVCGRSGQVIEHRGRASAAGERGCSIKLEEFMESISNS